jgi:hypothetical protein
MVWKEKGLRFSSLKKAGDDNILTNLSDIPASVVKHFSIDEYGNARLLRPEKVEAIGFEPNRWFKFTTEEKS